MSQLNRGAVISTGTPKASFTFVGVIKRHHLEDPRRPTPGRDKILIEIVSDPFTQGTGAPTIAGQEVTLYLDPKIKGQDSDMALRANSVHGLIQGYETRPPAQIGQICAFEKAVYDSATMTIQAEFVKLGPSPQTRQEGNGIVYFDVLAAALPSRIMETTVKQNVAILNVKDTVMFQDFREIEALIDEVRSLNRTPNGAEIGHPGFMLLSRRLPQSQAEDTPAFFADNRTRLASLVEMTPRHEDSNGRDVFTPMTTHTAISRIGDSHKSMVVSQPGWYHEFIPILCLPAGRNIKPKVSKDHQVTGFDRNSSYQLRDKDSNGEIVPADFGFAKSVVIAQRSERTHSWVASFIMPVSTAPTLVPTYEMITPQTHPGHRQACFAEIERLSAIRKEFFQRLLSAKKGGGYNPAYSQPQHAGSPNGKQPQQQSSQSFNQAPPPSWDAPQSQQSQAARRQNTTVLNF